MEQSIYPRELAEARLDAQYGVVFHETNARLYGGIRWAIAVVQLLLTSAAVAPLLTGGSARLVPWIGLLLAALTIIDIVSDFAGAQHKNTAIQKAYADLLASANDLAKMDRGLAKLAGDSVPTFRALEVPAYNAVVRSAGRESYARPLGTLSKLLCWVA